MGARATTGINAPRRAHRPMFVKYRNRNLALHVLLLAALVVSCSTSPAVARKKHLEAYLLLAQAMAGLQDLDAAVRETETAIRMDLGEARTYATLGRFLSERGNLKDAEEAFERALRVDPRSVEVMTAYGKFYFA